MQKIKLLKMIIPVEEKKFLNYTRNYIFQILKLGKKFNSKKTSLLSKEETLETN